MNEIYLKHLTKPHTLAEIEKLMERDYFLDAEQALEMGLVDKVLTSREEQEKAIAPLKGYKSDGGGNGEGGKGIPPEGGATVPS